MTLFNLETFRGCIFFYQSFLFPAFLIAFLISMVSLEYPHLFYEGFMLEYTSSMNSFQKMQNNFLTGMIFVSLNLFLVVFMSGLNIVLNRHGWDVLSAISTFFAGIYYIPTAIRLKKSIRVGKSNSEKTPNVFIELLKSRNQKLEGICKTNAEEIFDLKEIIHDVELSDSEVLQKSDKYRKYLKKKSSSQNNDEDNLPIDESNKFDEEL